MRAALAVGTTLLSVGIASCLLLGTVGWLGVGMGIGTYCTDAYNCTDSGCAPCDGAARWVIAGGVGQLVLAAVGVVLLVRLSRAGGARLVVAGAALVVLSVGLFAGTTWRASGSYCQPGSAGYDESYCAAMRD